MEFTEDVDSDVNQYTIDDLEPGLEVYADIGEVITDIRTATVKEVHEDQHRVSLTLGPGRMDDPYVVPIERVHNIID